MYRTPEGSAGIVVNLLIFENKHFRIKKVLIALELLVIVVI